MRLESHRNLEPALSQQFNQLWERSTETSPTFRFETAENFISCFENDAPIEYLIVRNDSRMLAALPILNKKWCGVFSVQTMLVNPWAQCGGLLIDAESETEVPSRLIADHVAKSSLSFLDLQWVDDPDGHWESLCEALRESGCEVHADHQFHVGVVHLPGEFEDYWKTLSKNHRKDLKRSEKRLAESGEVRFVRYRDFDDDKLQPLLQQAFEIEQRSWKGKQGSSVLSVEEASRYFFENARILAESGMFELQFLLLDGQPIAFEYGYTAKGTYFSHKVSYDPDFRKYGPGQQLMLHQLRSLCLDPEIERVDTMGILSSATAKWCNDAYRRKRFLISTASSTSRLLVRGLHWAKRLKHRNRAELQLEFKLRPMPPTKNPALAIA